MTPSPTNCKITNPSSLQLKQPSYSLGGKNPQLNFLFSIIWYFNNIVQHLCREFQQILTLFLTMSNNLCIVLYIVCSEIVNQIGHELPQERKDMNEWMKYGCTYIKNTSSQFSGSAGAAWYAWEVHPNVCLHWLGTTVTHFTCRFSLVNWHLNPINTHRFAMAACEIPCRGTVLVVFSR